MVRADKTFQNYNSLQAEPNMQFVQIKLNQIMSNQFKIMLVSEERENWSKNVLGPGSGNWEKDLSGIGAL